MNEPNLYALPGLPYGYGALQPYISEEQLKIHHQKHHQAYVNKANEMIQKIHSARMEKADFDAKATAKELSFNVSGHYLHSLFWKNLKPAEKGENAPKGGLMDELMKEFSNFDRFKKEFSQAALSCEGSGWAALAFCRETGRLFIAQIEKHNINLFADLPLIMVLDVWEHAYYLDYKNDRAKFIEGFWNIANWDFAESGLSAAKTAR